LLCKLLPRPMMMMMMMVVRWQREYLDETHSKVDDCHRVEFYLTTARVWLTVRLEVRDRFLGNIRVLLVMTICRHVIVIDCVEFYLTTARVWLIVRLEVRDSFLGEILDRPRRRAVPLRDRSRRSNVCMQWRSPPRDLQV
jgi:hypothetical protein